MAPAHAYELVYIQTSIDPAQWEILSSVIRTDVGVTKHSPEFRRIPDTDLESLTGGGNSVDEFSAGILTLKDHLIGDLKIANGVAQAGILNNIGIAEEKNRLLSFPTDQTRRDDSTPDDYEEALDINNELITGLNQAFNAYLTENSISKTNDAAAYMDKLVEFFNSCSGANAARVNDDKYQFENNGKTVTVKWKMQKSDGTWISWSAIAYEAFYNYSLEGDEAVNVNNIYADMNSNVFTDIIVGFFSMALDSIRSALGLWSMDELIFNQGIRETAYLGGIFPANWEAILWTLFSVFEIFGAAMLLAGVIISVVHKALSTTNVIERMHLMGKIQDLIICAVILALLPFALRILMSLSTSLTQISYDIIPDGTDGKKAEIDALTKRFTASNGTIGGLVGQFMYFGIQIYFNFYYAIRAFSVPVLIIMSPLFVCGICLSTGKKQQAMQWSRELISFIFMQPIHAFCMALILLLPLSSHPFDNIIALYALIPLSQTLKTLIFGQTSGFAEQTANQAKSTATKLTTVAGIGAATAGVKGIASVVGGVMSGGPQDGGSGNNGGDPGSSDPGSSDPGGGGSPMGNASSGFGGLARKAVGAVKGGVSQLGHKITNSRIGSAIKNNKGFMRAENGKELAIGALKTFALNPVYRTFKAARVGAKVASGMALGAVGGMVGAMGGRDLGHMMTGAGASILAGRNINADESSSEQNPQSDPSDSSNPSDPNPAEFPDVSPINLNTGGMREADDVVGDQVMEVRSFNQSNLDRMGISDVSYERGNLKFNSSGDSPQAQDLRAYAQYLDGLEPKQMQEEIQSRGISATQDGDTTRVRINSKTWSAANGGAQIDGYTNKKGESTIQVSSPKNGTAPSFTGGQVMNVDPTQIQGYQKTTRTVKNEDGTTKQEPVGSVPIKNTTAMQRAILSSGKGVTRDDQNLYLPLNQNGQPEKYVQRTSFTARAQHLQQADALRPQTPPPSNPDQPQPPPQGKPVQTEQSESPPSGSGSPLPSQPKEAHTDAPQTEPQSGPEVEPQADPQPEPQPVSQPAFQPESQPEQPLTQKSQPQPSQQSSQDQQPSQVVEGSQGQYDDTSIKPQDDQKKMDLFSMDEDLFSSDEDALRVLDDELNADDS